MAEILEFLTALYVGAITAGCVRAWQWIMWATPPMDGPIVIPHRARREIVALPRGFEPR